MQIKSVKFDLYCFEQIGTWNANARTVDKRINITKTTVDTHAQTRERLDEKTIRVVTSTVRD